MARSRAGTTSVLWILGDWRCELRRADRGESRLKVYCLNQLMADESPPAGEPVHYRAEVLRQWVLRGNLRWR